MLVLVMVFAFCFQVPMSLPCSPMGAHLFGHAMQQPYGLYLWQVYVPPGDGLWPTPGVS